jgi:hypothetical protein
VRTQKLIIGGLRWVSTTKYLSLCGGLLGRASHIKITIPPPTLPSHLIKSPPGASARPRRVRGGGEGSNKMGGVTVKPYGLPRPAIRRIK